MAGCMMCATAGPQSTMIHSPLSSPSIRAWETASFTASRTLEARALVWRLEVPDATITRSNSGDRCSVLKTWMSCALIVFRPSTMARWVWQRLLAAVSDLVGWSSGSEIDREWNQYSAQRGAQPEGYALGVAHGRRGVYGVFGLLRS